MTQVGHSGQRSACDLSAAVLGTIAFAHSRMSPATVIRGPAASTTRPIVYDEEEFRRLPAQVEVYRAALALLAGDIGGTRTHAQGALARTEPSDHLGRGAASALLGLAAWTQGDLETADDRYAGALQAFIDAGI